MQQISRPRNVHIIIALWLGLFVSLMQQVNVNAQNKKLLTFGAVGYDIELGNGLKGLIEYLNKNARPDGFGIREIPALLSYESAIKFTIKRQLDIVFLTPLAYAKVQSKTDQFKPVAIIRNPNAVYVGEIFFNPRTITRDSLKLNKNELVKRFRPTLGLVSPPYSASGYLFPMRVFDKKGLLNSTATGIGRLRKHFEVDSTILTYTEALDKFFEGKIDIISVYDGALKRYLENKKELFAVVRKNIESNFGLTLDSHSIRKIETEIRKHCLWDITDAIPNSVIAVRTDSEIQNLDRKIKDYLEKLYSNGSRSYTKTLKNQLGIHGFVTTIDDIWRDKYKKVDSLFTTYQGNGFDEEGGMNADRVVQDLAYDIKFRHQLDRSYVPKIAVVLSGGGAAGAYQAGVLTELRSAFHRFRQLHMKDDSSLAKIVGIHLYAGTSVGAINAVAASLTSTNDDSTLRNLWKKNISSDKILSTNSKNERLDRWKFLVFKMSTQYKVITLGFSGLIFLVLFRVVFKKLEVRLKGLKRSTILILVGLAIVWTLLFIKEFIVLVLTWGLIFALWVRRQPRRPKIVKLVLLIVVITGSILVFTSTQLPAALWIGVLASLITIVHIIGMFFNWLAERKKWAFADFSASTLLVKAQTGFPKIYKLYISEVKDLIVTVAFIFVFCLIPFQIFETLFVDNAFFYTSKLEKTLKENYGLIINNVAADSMKLPEMSKYMVNALKTDVVITTTDFTHSREDDVYPKEVYFYKSNHLPEKPETIEPPQWISIEENNSNFLKMIVASASIFPGFPPCKIDNLSFNDSENGKKTKPFLLIDGGFLHNVPVQAALQLRATHVIIIRLQPEKTKTVSDKTESKRKENIPHSTLENLGDTFSLLFERAQSNDNQVIYNQRTFLIAPKIRKIGVFDFDGRYNNWGSKEVELAEFYDDGCNDAKSNGFRQKSIGKPF